MILVIDIGNTNLSPALSISWDPFSTGKNKLAVSARRYHDKIFLNVPLVEINPATTTLVFNAALDEAIQSIYDASIT